MLFERGTTIPKQSRYTLWQRCENACLDTLEGLIIVPYLPIATRREKVLGVSSSIDMLRILVRLAYDTKAIDKKFYLTLQEHIDEMGRMIGGWLKTLR